MRMRDGRLQAVDELGSPVRPSLRESQHMLKIESPGP